MVNTRTQSTFGRRGPLAFDGREALVVSAHALAFILFFVSPLAGVAALMTVVVLTFGVRKPAFIATACMGLIWINDPIADFHPYTPVTAWKDALLLLLILGWLFHAALFRLPLVRRSEITIPLLLFVALYTVMCFQSDSFVGAILGMKAVVFYTFWFFVLPSIIKSRDDVRNLVAALIIGTVCVSVYNLWKVQQPFGTFPAMRTGRMFPGILQAHFSSSGLLIPAGLLLLVTLAPLAKGWMKAVMWFALLVVAAGFLATTLRSSWGSAIAGLLVIGWLGRRMPQVIAALMVAMIAALILQSSMEVEVSTRALSAFDTQDVSRTTREEEFRAEMVPFVLKHPFGLGTGSMSALSSAKVWAGGSRVPFAIQGGLVHNNLLMIAIETGWVGPIVFMWFLAGAFLMSLRNYRQAVDPFIKAVSLALCGFVTFYICMQPLGPILMMPSISFIAFAMFALLVILPDLDRPEDESEALAEAASALPQNV